MKRQVIDQLRAEYPIKQLCEVLNCPRSSYYHHPVETVPDGKAVQAVEAILMHYSFCGYRCCHQKLLKTGYTLSQ